MVDSKVQFSFLFWPHHVVCGILVPWPGIEPGPSPVKVQGPNHWTAMEFPVRVNTFKQDDS